MNVYFFQLNIFIVILTNFSLRLKKKIIMARVLKTNLNIKANKLTCKYTDFFTDTFTVYN